MTLLAPFPWFGGKSRVSDLVWQHFGDTPNYVEPFAGSLAVLLARPAWDLGTGNWQDDMNRVETVNDLDCLLSNFWRAVQCDPDAVAWWADWPVNEADLHARHCWLVQQKDELAARLNGDPDYYEAKIAGWWVWGICAWIGSGWCSGRGPWQSVDGALVNVGDAGRGVNRQLPHLGDAGQGVNRQRQTDEWSEHLRSIMGALSDRLRRVRVCCGNWDRVCGPTPTEKNGLTAVFLDPPYSSKADREIGLYRTDDGSVAHAVREWAIEHGDNPLLRIALCGYDGEHAMPENWTAVPWKARGGYGSQGDGRGRKNAGREVIWFSPHCLKVETEPAYFVIPQPASLPDSAAYNSEKTRNGYTAYPDTAQMRPDGRAEYLNGPMPETSTSFSVGQSATETVMYAGFAGQRQAPMESCSTSTT